MGAHIFRRGIISLAAVTVVAGVGVSLLGNRLNTDYSQYTADSSCSYTHLPDTPPDEIEHPVENYVDNVENSTQGVLYTEEELEILAIIIYQEAGGDRCSDDTRRKVGSVFLNRVKSDRFPNTFEEVATQKRQYGTLYWTGLKWPSRATNEYEAHAVKRAYSIAEELLLSGSILPDNVIWQAEFVQGDGIYCHQDNFYFCYTEEDR